MIKYSHKDNPAIANYWDYCTKYQIPHIEIISQSRDYITISYDLLACLPFDNLKGDVSENIVKIYEAYSDFFKIPKDKFSYAGGSTVLGIVVRKEHSEFIANRLFDYLSEYVSKNKTPMAESRNQK